MKTSQETHRNWMTAISFAEAGEWDTARAMIPSTRRTDKISRLQKIFMAVAYAEAGLHAEALRLINTCQQKSHVVEGFLDAVGLRGVRVTYGVLAAETIRPA